MRRSRTYRSLMGARPDWPRLTYPAVGERWAYRAGADDQLVEVEIRRIGVRRPLRMGVRFEADQFEGLRA